MTIQADFEAAAQRAQQLPAKPSNTVLLQLYALYKQATEGDATDPRPGGFDFKAIAKHDAWHQLHGLGQDAARQQYVELVNELAG
ncbi:MAG: acyl-CoA-binding protein [Janthinobacterium lividum]